MKIWINEKHGTVYRLAWRGIQVRLQATPIGADNVVDCDHWSDCYETSEFPQSEIDEIISKLRGYPRDRHGEIIPASDLGADDYLRDRQIDSAADYAQRGNHE